MANPAAELDEIERIHDEQPAAAAARLRAIDPTTLPPACAPLAAFLFNHVLGERLGAWPEAAAQIARMRMHLGDAPVAVLVHAAVADELAGDRASTARAALVAASAPAAAECAIGLRRLAFTQGGMAAGAFAAALLDLAQAAAALTPAAPLDGQIAAGLNNATSCLLDFDAADPAVCVALDQGAAQALRFWRSAGTWVQHERALYLVALVANRIGAHAQARDAAREALDLIAAHGPEDVDRAFLLLQLAGASAQLGDGDTRRAAHAEARSIAAGWNEQWLTQWFATEEAKLFGGAPTRNG